MSLNQMKCLVLANSLTLEDYHRAKSRGKEDRYFMIFFPCDHNVSAFVSVRTLDMEDKPVQS